MKRYAMAAVAGLSAAGMMFFAAGTMSPCMAAGTPRGNGDEVRRLWKDCSAALENDLPVKACDILGRIKDISRAEGLSYDFFRASKEYVKVNAGIDWRRRDSLTKAMETEFRSYGDPVVLYAAGLDFKRGDASECAAFLEKWGKKLRNGRNSDFWADAPVGYKGEVLLNHIADDYEYVLLSMAFNRTLMNSRGYEKIDGDLKSEYAETYPVAALHGLFRINADNRDEYAEKYVELCGYAEKYEGRAVSALAKLYALPLKFHELGENKAGGEEYRSLRRYCEALVSEKKGFTGEEGLILKDENAAEDMIEELDSKNLEAEVRGKAVKVRLRNLTEVKISVYAGENLNVDKLSRKDVPVWEKSLENEVGSYYVYDTLNVELPELSDGDYLAVFESGKIRECRSLERHSVALSAVRSADGWLFYAADRISGEPAGEVELTVGSWNGKELLRKKVCFKGAELMDSEIQSALKGVGGRCWVQCSLIDGQGFARSSEKLSLYTAEDVATQVATDWQAQLLTDRSAYRPGETLNFKTILYKDYRNGKMNAAPAGENVKIVLADAENKDVRTVVLTTNEYGSVAGKFDIPGDRRSGEWRLTVSAGGNVLNAERFTVDEFKLPEFSVSFVSDGVKYFPGETVPVRGRVFSYAGNSLSDAKVEYRVSDWNGVVSKGSPELDGEGNFSIPVGTESGRSSSFTVTLTVTDGAGQTLEFSRWLRIGTGFGINAELKDAAEGSFVKAGSEDGGGFSLFRQGGLVRNGILKGNRACFDVRLTDCSGKQLDGDIDWELRSGPDVLEKGGCTSGKTLEIDLSGRRDGLYTVEFSKTYEYSAVKQAAGENASGGGQKEKVTEKLEYELLLLSDDGVVLDAEIESAFKVVESGDGNISLLFGAAQGEVRANVMLFDRDARLLINESICLEGVRGKEGSLKKIDWKYGQQWSDRVLLRVEYFKNGRHRCFEHEYQRDRRSFELPLSVETFTDSCLPGTEYRVTLRTGKSAELLAAVFDRSTEDIRSNVWRTVVPASGSICVDSSVSTGCDFNRQTGAGAHLFRLAGEGDGIMTKSSAALSLASVTNSAEMEDAVTAGVTAEDSGAGNVDLLNVRKDFLNTLAFEPFLRSDGNGDVEFRFRTSDKLSTYILSVFAHDKSFRNATIRREFIVSRPVTVTVHEPSLLYGGDRCIFRPSVSNNSGKAVEGTLTVFIHDGDEFSRPLSVQNCHLSIGAGESVTRDFAVIVPEASSMASYRNGRAQLSIKTVFDAEEGDESGFSDAVLVRIPVLDGKQVLTESHSAVFRTGMDRDSLVRDLEGRFVNTTHYEAVSEETKISDLIAETLAQKSELKSDNLLDISELLYVRLVSGNCGDGDGAVRNGKEPGGEAVCDGDGNGCEDGNDEDGIPALVKKLLDCRCEDGGFAWFSGMSSSPVLTAVLLERLALLREDGKLPEGTDWDGIFGAAVRYIDRQMFLNRDGRHWFGGISTEQYAYVRSFFPETAVDTKSIKSEAGAKRFKEMVGEIKTFLQASAKDDRLNGRVLEKARRNAALLNLVTADSDAFASSLGLKCRRMKKTLGRNIESLKEYAVEHPSGGICYPNAVMPFRALLSSEAYAHSIICDMFTRWSRFSALSSGKADARAWEIADGIRLWLMIQKESQRWESNFEFINAVNSVSKGSPELMETSVISLSKTYEKPFGEIKAAGNGFTITRQFLVEELVPGTVKGQEGTVIPTLRELRSGETLTVGQKVVVRLCIGSDENRSLVHIRMPYNACLRPVRQLSGSFGYALRGWRINASAGGAKAWWISPQGYREVHEAALDYWFDIYPEQDTVIEDEFRVSQQGVFTAPVCEIESLYAPRYRANSAFGGSLTVTGE